MFASEVATHHFTAAMAEAAAHGLDPDAMARQFLSLAVRSFLERRPIGDVRTELLQAAENVDPDTDYMFMRP